jgi:hypothetical protein
MRKLNTYVHAHAVNDDGSVQSQVFGPGDTLPDWARKAITNPKVWDGEDDEPVEETPAVLERPAGNASREKWAAYAQQEGVKLEPDMQRDDIKAAVDLAKE